MVAGDLQTCTETLVPAGSWPKSGSLVDDFAMLENLVEDEQPAYLLVRSDSSSSEWLFVSYVPDTAKVRDKVHTTSSECKTLTNKRYTNLGCDLRCCTRVLAVHS